MNNNETVIECLKKNILIYITLFISFYILNKKLNKNILILLIQFLFVGFIGYLVHLISHKICFTDLYNDSNIFLKKNKYLDYIGKIICKYLLDFHSKIHHDLSINKKFINIVLESINNFITQGFGLLLYIFVINNFNIYNIIKINFLKNNDTFINIYNIFRKYIVQKIKYIYKYLNNNDKIFIDSLLQIFKNPFLQIFSNSFIQVLILLLLIYFITKIDYYMILFWTILYVTTHNINFNLIPSFTHRQHHVDPLTNLSFGFDLYDVIFKTSEVTEYRPDIIINIIVITAILYYIK